MTTLIEGFIHAGAHPLAHGLMHALGWTLLHFCWQGLLVASVLWCVLGMLGGRSSQARYGAACSALLLLVVAPMMTFARLATAEYRLVQANTGASVAIDPGMVLWVGAGDLTAAWPMRMVMAVDHWVPWILLVWFAGVVLYVGRLNLGLVVAHRMKSRDTHAPPVELQRMFDGLRRRLGIARAVSLMHSAWVEVPTVIGWMRPVVLIPVSCLTGLSTDQIEAIFCHELAHVRRHDYLVSVFQSVVEALLFYHPAVWWVSKQVRRERECCCDELAVEVGGDVLAYAQALAGFEGLRLAHVRAAVTANGNSLRSRIRRLLHPANDIAPWPSAAWAAALAMAAVCVVVVLPAAPPQATVASRSEVWADTVKRGDMDIKARGLGKMTSVSTAEVQIAESQSKALKVGQAVLMDVMLAPAGAVPGKILVQDKDGKTKGEVMPNGQKLLMPPRTVLLPGTLQRVSSASGGVLTAYVQITGKPPDMVKAGQKLDATIAIEQLKDVVYVGRPVFGQADTDATLLKVSADGNSAMRTKVQFGRSSVNTIEVRGGLQVGDKVVLSDMKKYDGVDRITLK